MTALGGILVDEGPTPDAEAPPVLERVLFGPVTAALAVLATGFGLLDLLHVAVPYALQVAPFAASVLLLGLPHGALDHLVPARTEPGIPVPRSIATVVGLYALLGGATALLWTALPAAGFAVFIAVTWFHWGQGDLWLDRALRGTVRDRADAVLTVLVRGALPMLVPLVAHPADYAAVFRMTTGLVGAGAGDGALLQSVPVRAAAALLIAALVAAHLVLRRRTRALLRVDAVELAVLVAFFATVPPVLAVGLYFTCWHAVRHIVRLQLADPVSRAVLARGGLVLPFARFLHAALPVTCCAIVLLAGLGLALRDAGLGTYLLLIAALTTPHTAIVTWMDRRRAARLSPS